ncbi:30S ribosomal protein S8 [Candidatus Peregrinibacteria bacterium]|nr:30S ribosomal protein S8 [Candidatus Peregrinibacteria bacterium]
MHTDPIADLLTRIRNGQKAHHERVTVPHSTIKENILKVLQNKGFIENYETAKEGNFNVLQIALKEDRSNINFRRISKPGQRIYTKTTDLKTVKSGLGITILSTSKGIMSNMEAKKQKLGGEVICEIY